MHHPTDNEIIPLPALPEEEKLADVVVASSTNSLPVGFDPHPEGNMATLEPNDEQLATLRRVSEAIPLRAWYSPTEPKI
jgi:hypothetical protein